MVLAPSAVLAGEELHQHRSEGRRFDVVGLTREGAALRIGKGVSDRLRRVAHPQGLPTVDNDFSHKNLLFIAELFGELVARSGFSHPPCQQHGGILYL